MSATASSAVSPCLEVTEAILEVGGATANICMQCGTCTAVCPWNLVKPFNPRALLRLISLGLEGVEGDPLWSCVTCHTCVSRCPRGVDLIDVLRATRAVMAEMGGQPASYADPLASLGRDGNPWIEPRSQRAEWQEGLDVPAYGPDTEWLAFTCCTQAYDPRNTRVARALIALYRAAGLSFGSLKERESCCGDQASKVGALDVFARLADANTRLFDEHEVSRVVVGSPHCLNAFCKDYADLREPPEVVHHAVLLSQLIDRGDLAPKRPLDRVVTYHDPCYLGRHNGIYDEPRRALASIPGLKLVEMPRNRETALCCGGGGGGIWREVPVSERFAVLRVEEARAVGAEIIATACPYCLSMLEDAVKALDLEEQIQVRDVAELLAESIAADPKETD